MATIEERMKAAGFVYEKSRDYDAMIYHKTYKAIDQMWSLARLSDTDKDHPDDVISEIGNNQYSGVTVTPGLAEKFLSKYQQDLKKYEIPLTLTEQERKGISDAINQYLMTIDKPPESDTLSPYQITDARILFAEGIAAHTPEAFDQFNTEFKLRGKSEQALVTRYFNDAKTGKPENALETINARSLDENDPAVKATLQALKSAPDIDAQMQAAGFSLEDSAASGVKVYHGVFKQIDLKTKNFLEATIFSDTSGSDDSGIAQERMAVLSNAQYSDVWVPQETAQKFLSQLHTLDRFKINPALTDEQRQTISASITRDRTHIESVLNDATPDNGTLIGADAAVFKELLPQRAIKEVRALFTASMTGVITPDHLLNDLNLLTPDEVMLLKHYAEESKKTKHADDILATLNTRPTDSHDPAVKAALQDLMGEDTYKALYGTMTDVTNAGTAGDVNTHKPAGKAILHR